MNKARGDLLAIYQAALEAVNGRRCVADALRHDSFPHPAYLIAIGKAAPAMAEGALQVIGDSILDGLVITKHGHAQIFHSHLTLIEAGHPRPDQASLDAGHALLAFLNKLPGNGQLLFLISGGASSLVEVLPAGIGLDELERLNTWLLGSGLPIHDINRVRKAVSGIKGGRLAGQLGGRRVECLLLSDVPGDDPATIGSGLLVADPQAADPPPAALPAWISDLCRQVPPMPAPDDSCFNTIHCRIIADNRTARLAAVQAAGRLGYAVIHHDELITGNALAAGQRLAAEVLHGPAGLHIWGGETTVRLPPHPGRGGRCQSLALAAAIALQGEAGVYLLAAGTDGSDGPGEDAGALVDGGTVERGADAGYAAEHCLSAADAGRFLEGSGDLIHTGPTGSNVMDILLGLRVDGFDITCES